MRITWLTGVDQEILEYLADKGVDASPRVLAHNMDRDLEGGAASYGHIKRRMRKLRRAGLLERYDDDAGIYGLSELGRQYMAGELDRERIEEISRAEPNGGDLPDNQA